MTGILQMVLGSKPAPVTFTVTDLLVVASGGGGGSFIGGGGGAGGYRTSSSESVTTGTSYTITVGAGGPIGTVGNDSVFSSITSDGGGAGGEYLANGGNGGSGGGGGGQDGAPGAARNGGTATSGQGSNGGTTPQQALYGASGGGGFIAGGSVSSNGNGANGGNGTTNSITGPSVGYAGGGGGGNRTSVTGNGGEGWDARLDAGLAPDAPIDVELSVGDVVLSGGELGAMMVIDACARLLPGVLGDENSSVEDSFSSGALDHPHYARPAEWRGQAVPEVLMSGDHAAIRRWRRQQALARTWERRPDLLDGLVLSPDEQEWLRAYIAQHAIDAKR